MSIGFDADSFIPVADVVADIAAGGSESDVAGADVVVDTACASGAVVTDIEAA